MTVAAIPKATMSDEGLKNSLIVSGLLHLIALLFMYFGLPHLMPPLPPQPHPPVPLSIVAIADITNTRVEQPQEQKQPEPPPPKPEPKPEQKMQQPESQPTPKPEPKQEQVQVQPLPKPEAEALKVAAKPKPKPPDNTQQASAFSSLLNNLAKKQHTVTPQATTPSETKSETKSSSTANQVASLSDRLTISEEDALRRQIEQCWNPPIGARDAKNLVVEITIDVNPDRTVSNAEIVDKGRYASDSFFRAAADAAKRAVLNPQCSPLMLPPDKYDQWKRIDFTFDPRDAL